MIPSTRTALEIPCCICGTLIFPNAANQCSACLAQDFNLQDLLNRGPGGAHEIVINQCRKCRRYKRTDKVYEHYDTESPELLALCLKTIPALSSNAQQRLILKDAMWVWTEPHSMRLKVRLTIQTEIHNVQIQQRVLVELVVRFNQCPECNREYTNRTWHALVQLRQKRNDDSSKTGLATLEMALARNSAIRKPVLKIDTTRNGFDFYFMNLSEAQMFASYLARVAPMRVKATKKLVSADVKNNTANMKHTVSCDMVPLCRGDLIMINKSAKGALAGKLALVSKVSSVLHLVDASPKRGPTMEDSLAELSSDTYYRSGAEKTYQLLYASNRLTRFVVLDVELCGDNNSHAVDDDLQDVSFGPKGFALADVEVAREADFGQNDETFRCVTHLGSLLQPGDVVVGYDLVSTVLSGTIESNIQDGFNSNYVMPDIVLVKKGKPDPETALEKQTKSRASKRKERRAKKEEKRMRELEESALRMGFLEEAHEKGSSGAEVHSDYLDDPELMEELKALETGLSSLTTNDAGEGRSTSLS